MQFHSLINKYLQAAISILLLLSSGFLIADELKNLNPEQIEALREKGALVVDIRTPKEWETTGIIPNSKTLEFFNRQGKFDAEKWVNKLNEIKSSSDQPVILVCRSGNRSSMVGNFLTQKLGMKNIYHLQNGITSWIKAGKDTSKNQSITKQPSK